MGLLSIPAGGSLHWRAALALLLALCSSAPSAATITVDTSASGSSSSACTLLDAVASANRDSAVGGCVAGDADALDTIVFADALANTTIRPGGTLVLENAPLAINGGSLGIILSGDNQYRLIESKRGSPLRRLQGLTFVNGATSTDGGAIDNDGTLEVIACTVRQSQAGDDGGAINNKGSLAVKSSIVAQNSSGDDGGAISNKGTLTIDRSTVDRNTASDDAGAISNSGSLTIWNSAISNNVAKDDAGAIDNEGTVLIHNSTFSLNSTENDSGAIDNSGDMIIEQATLDENTTTDDGGAVYNTGTLTILGSTLANNEAGDDGGAIYNASGDSAGTLSIQNNTFFANSAGDDGGAIYNEGGNNPGSLSIVNSTLTNNIAIDEGATLAGAGDLGLLNTVIADSQGSMACAEDTVLMTNFSNWLEDSSCDGTADGDPQLGPLADNGGPTLTQMPQGLGGLVDAGANAQCLLIDQRGVTRPQGGACDIGAVEVVVSRLDNCADGPMELQICVPARGGWRSTLGR